MYDKQVDASGLAIFRILYGSVLFLEINFHFYFRTLIYDLIPGIAPHEIDTTFPLLFWMVAALCIVFGLFTRLATIVSYLFTMTLLAPLIDYEYHMNWAWVAGNFLLMFVPLGRRYSLDQLLVRLRYSNAQHHYKLPRTVSQLAYYAPVAVLLGFVYFNSTLYKVVNQNWLDGLGLWKYSSIPTLVIANHSWMLNQELLVKFLGYLTMVFEITLIFLIWFKRLRPYLLFIGLGLHFGIFLEFPIPLFGFGYCAIYMLLVPISWWRLLGQWLKLGQYADQTPYLTIYYDGECPLCARTRIVLEHVDVRNRLAFRTVQAAAAAEPALAAIAPGELLRNIYAVDRHGRVFSGLATYIRALSAIWYLKPVAWLLRLPGINQLARRVYGYVAANRLTERCTDDNCGYTPLIAPADDRTVRVLHNVTRHDLKVWATTAGLGLLTALQLIVSYKTPGIAELRKALGVFKNNPVDNTLNWISMQTLLATSTSIGITNHGVFIHDIDNYNHAVAVTYVRPDGREEWLPITTPEGFCDVYCYAGLWARWGFRAVSTNTDQAKVDEAVQDYTAFWAMKHGVDLTHARFNVKVKYFDAPRQEWVYDFLKTQTEQPWQNAGYVEWVNLKCTPHIREIESFTKI